MLRGGAHGPVDGVADAAAPRPETQAAAVAGVLSAEQVAEAVVAGIRDERFLILPHPDVATFEQRRAADRDRWLAGMRRLSADLASGARGAGTPTAESED
jgi:hypothetical protein